MVLIVLPEGTAIHGAGVLQIVGTSAKCVMASRTLMGRLAQLKAALTSIKANTTPKDRLVDERGKGSAHMHKSKHNTERQTGR